MYRHMFPNICRCLLAGCRPWLRAGLASTLLALPLIAQAETYPLPSKGEDIIGEIRTVIAQDTDTLVDIARAQGFGYEAMRAANPSVDAWMPRAGTHVTLPSRYILPSGPREGIVVNTAEMRLYYFPKAKAGQAAVVETFPVAIGRGDWRTPRVLTKVSGKVKDPIWYPPESIRIEHARDGDHLPKVVGAGPDNPLGKYALRLTIPSYLIHGTNKEYGVGMQVTHGCIRMYPEHIEKLFHAVPVGTAVRIVYEPVKIGWQRGQLFMETHPPLDGVPQQEIDDPTALLNAVNNAIKLNPEYPVNWQQAQVVKLESSGMPTSIGPALFAAQSAQLPPAP